MSQKTAIVFPGQGSQKLGMLKKIIMITLKHSKTS